VGHEDLLGVDARHIHSVRRSSPISSSHAVNNLIPDHLLAVLSDEE